MLLVILGVVLLAVAAATLAAGPLADQTRQLAQDLPRSFQSLRDRMTESSWGAWLSERIPQPDDGATQGMGLAATAASTTIGWFGDAAVPAMLLAATMSPWLALWVALVFLVIQFIEGNILAPLVQAEMSDLPPAALLMAQVLMASFFGLLGIALAAPLAAVAAVLIRRGYAEGWRGREPATDDSG